MRYLSPDGDGSGGSQTTQTTTQTTQTTDQNNAARAAAFDAELKQNKGDALRMAEKQFDRVYALRQRAQAAEAKIPKEGDVIVSSAEATALKAYREMGTAKELQEKGNRLVQLEQYQMVSEAASVAGMNPKVLSKLLPGEAKLEIGEATDEDGQAKRVVSVLVEGKDKIRLAKYAEANWSDFLPALKAPGEDDQTGKQWIQQQGSTKGDANTGMNPILAERLKRAEKRATAEKPII